VNSPLRLRLWQRQVAGNSLIFETDLVVRAVALRLSILLNLSRIWQLTMFRILRNTDPSSFVFQTDARGP